MNISSQVISDINLLANPAIIAISGFGGAGKSTFTNILSKKTNIPVVELDYFFLGYQIKKYSKWQCFDFKRLEKEVCVPFLKENKRITYQEYDWENNCIGDYKTITNNGKIIIEGVGLFQPDLINYFSYKIWIDCPIELAIKRGKQREIDRNNPDQEEYWDGIWKRNDEECFSLFNPKEIADTIVSNDI